MPRVGGGRRSRRIDPSAPTCLRPAKTADCSAFDTGAHAVILTSKTPSARRQVDSPEQCRIGPHHPHAIGADHRSANPDLRRRTVERRRQRLRNRDHHPVTHIALGGIDLRKDFGTGDGDTPVQYVLSHLAAARSSASTHRSTTSARTSTTPTDSSARPPTDATSDSWQIQAFEECRRRRGAATRSRTCRPPRRRTCKETLE